MTEAVRNLPASGGDQALTLAGLKEALQQSNTRNFILLFSDEVGDDLTDQTLMDEILALKNSTKSEIVFLMVPNSNKTFEAMKTDLGDFGEVINIQNRQTSTAEVVEVLKKSKMCSSPASNPNQRLRMELETPYPVDISPVQLERAKKRKETQPSTKTNARKSTAKKTATSQTTSERSTKIETEATQTTTTKSTTAKTTAIEHKSTMVSKTTTKTI